MSGASSGHDPTVWDRELVVQVVEAESILEEHATYATSLRGEKRFTEGTTLAYVTPWNGHGYEVAKTFRGKFDLLSPTWFQIPWKEEGKEWKVEGGHDVDVDWMLEVRTNETGRIVPRFSFQGWTLPQYQTLIEGTDQMAIKGIAQVILEEVEDHGFDGVTLECAAIHALGGLLDLLGTRLHEQGKLLILVLPPYREDQAYPFTPGWLKKWDEQVDYYSIMTYDYSLANGPGPNAPIRWMEEAVETLVGRSPNSDQRAKVLLGLNFYGYAFHVMDARAEAVINTQYLGILEQFFPVFRWDRSSKESCAEYTLPTGETREVWYPTLKSIAARVDLARELGVGVSIWEIGQGLDYFYDLI
ncbi:MAG: glycoside hydrolase superfamily [Piptocephalis tieghemiana]|nr:MAG: glycoside hydrolase superfamily [Piptocephalis tieghemiana]